jgi:hypothetical protein
MRAYPRVSNRKIDQFLRQLQSCLHVFAITLFMVVATNSLIAQSLSPMTIDASQFSGTDMCAKINAAYMSSAFAGSIDATAFAGLQPCTSNPFHGKNAVVHLYLNPTVTIITSTPWFTPQVTHSIEGLVAGNITETGGATIEACGPTVPTGVTFASGACTITSSGTVVAQFPGATAISGIAGTVTRTATCATTCIPLAPGQAVDIVGSSVAADNGFQIVGTVTGTPPTSFTFSGSGIGAATGASVSTRTHFNIPHGPFPVGDYSAVVNEGGQGASEGDGWNLDGDAWLLKNVKVELGGNFNIFGVYTVNSQERSLLEQSRGGPACGTDAVGNAKNCANVFYDRTEMPLGTGGTQNAGITRPTIRDFNMASETGPTNNNCTSCYGVVFEGSAISVQLTSTGCSQPPTAYVTSVNTSGAIQGIAVGNNGVGGCLTATVSHIYGAPTSYGAPLTGLQTSAAASAPIVNGVISQINIGTAGSGYSTALVTGGPILENINIAPTGSAKFQNGIWIEGVLNAEISKVHCLNLLEYCAYFGIGTYTQGGILRNLDGNGTTLGPIHLGFAIDNSQTISSISSGATNLVQDDKNNSTLSVAAYGKTLSQYNPGALYLKGGANLSNQPLFAEIANNTTTAPTLSEPVVLTTTSGASTATVATTSSTIGVEGICVGNCATSGNAQVAKKGTALCVFDGATTAGDYVQISTGTAGNCHDAGASYPVTKQVIGRVLSTNAAAGTYAMLVYPEGNIGAGGAMLDAFCLGQVGGTVHTYVLAPAAIGAASCNIQTGAEMPMVYACTAQNLYVSLGTATNLAGGLTITLYKGGTSQSLHCNVPMSGTTCSDLSAADDVAFTAGNMWSVRATTTGNTDAASDIRVAFQCQ